MQPTSPNNDQTKPLTSYDDVMKSQAQEAFNRVFLKVNKGLEEGTATFLREADFWKDFLSLMEYITLK